MKTRGFLAALALVLLLAPGASALNGYQSFTWQVSHTLEDARDYIDEISYRGFGFDTRKFKRRDGNFAYGFSLAWNILDQESSETIYVRNGAVTGKQRRYLNVFPILLTGTWWLGDRRSSQMFVGAGAGAYYVIQTFDIGVWRLEETNWHFGIAPEAGFRFPFGQTVDLYLSARYHYAFESGEYLGGEKSPISMFTLNLGLGGYSW